jgi:hypothetical protein
MTAADAHRVILAVWRIEQPRLITGLARMLRDVPLAEDLTQEALLAALDNPLDDPAGGPMTRCGCRFRVHHRHRHRLLTLAHVPAGIAGDVAGGRDLLATHAVTCYLRSHPSLGIICA